MSHKKHHDITISVYLSKGEIDFTLSI